MPIPYICHWLSAFQRQLHPANITRAIYRLCSQPLSDFSPCLSRKSTFTSIVSAKERVQQLCNQLSRTNTMSSSNTSAQALDNEQQIDPTSASASAGQSGEINIDKNVEDTFNQLGTKPPVIREAHPKFHHDVPPNAIHKQEFSVFLAGSIEMGKAILWQKRMASLLQHLPISVYNPRRGEWNSASTAEQRKKDFHVQVDWELNALETASVICFFFDQATLSPVTMFELGLWSQSKKVVVCCNRKFWKWGNVEHVCVRYGIPLAESFEELTPLILAMLREKGMMLDKKGDLTNDAQLEDKEWAPGPELLHEAALQKLDPVVEKEKEERRKLEEAAAQAAAQAAAES